MTLKSSDLVRVVLVAMVSCWVASSAVAESKPWPLRDHYSFTGESIEFLVDPKNAEWHATTRTGVSLIDLAYTEIELGDGRRIRLSEQSWITDGRDDFKDRFGAGTRFRSEFKPIDGLHIEYHVNRYSNHAFMTVMMVVRNTSGQPLNLRAIRLGMMDEGTLNPGATSTLISDVSTRRGMHLVPSSLNRMSLAKLNSPDGNGMLGIGLLQSGFVDSSVQFTKGADGWGGTIESLYDPPIAIAPGKSAQSDALWIMSAGRDAYRIDEFHGWAEGFIMPRTSNKIYPTAWLTVSGNDDSRVLLDAAGKIRVQGLNHALVPGGWPATSGDMPLDRLAQAIKRKRMVPGLTVDPLVAARSNHGFTIPGPSGRHWVDLRTPEARDYGVSQLRKYIKWDYEFFAIQRSDIPDIVLQEMNITRSVADLVAFEMMESAAGEIPVMPSSQLVLGNDEKGWSTVAQTTSSNREFQVLTGPTRLDVNGLDALSPGVVQSMQAVNGPIEIVGIPSKLVREQLDSVITIEIHADE